MTPQLTTLASDTTPETKPDSRFMPVFATELQCEADDSSETGAMYTALIAADTETSCGMRVSNLVTLGWEELGRPELSWATQATADRI